MMIWFIVIGNVGDQLCVVHADDLIHCHWQCWGSVVCGAHDDLVHCH